jgi:hypothetical protein
VGWGAGVRRGEEAENGRVDGWKRLELSMEGKTDGMWLMEKDEMIRGGLTVNNIDFLHLRCA